MFKNMEAVRQHRLLHFQQPGVWHAPGEAPPVTAQEDVHGPINSSEALPDAPGFPDALTGSQEARFPEGYAVPHTPSPVQLRRLLDGAWAHAAIMNNAPLREDSHTVAEAVQDGIAALQSTDYVGTEEAQVEVNGWLEDLQTWWRVREAAEKRAVPHGPEPRV